jgi:hypothetical protein
MYKSFNMTIGEKKKPAERKIQVWRGRLVPDGLSSTDNYYQVSDLVRSSRAKIIHLQAKENVIIN